MDKYDKFELIITLSFVQFYWLDESVTDYWRMFHLLNPLYIKYNIHFFTILLLISQELLLKLHYTSNNYTITFLIGHSVL